MCKIPKKLFLVVVGLWPGQNAEPYLIPSRTSRIEVTGTLDRDYVFQILFLPSISLSYMSSKKDNNC